jgi:tol-pal system protein YbgF
MLKTAAPSLLSDNAQYWIGETYYAQKNYPKSIEAFEAVMAQYPGGDKAAVALLKLAYSQAALDRRAEARNNLEKLIRQYPGSNEANLARARLEELDN